MSDSTPKKLSTEAYKGVRDFYPENQAIENYIFSIWRKVVERYGYNEYNASVLEPSELYRAKSGEEIVNEQTYTFKDRGDRDVTLRPEMTPTLARMVAARKRELAFPLRWYSIPNLFRYENPQRGRLREHWQLNVDLFGVQGIEAEIEIISIAYDIVRAYGLSDTDFEIRINNRRVMNYILFDLLGLSEENAHTISKLIDKKDKVDEKFFKESLTALLKDKADMFLTLLNSKNFEEFTIKLNQTKEEHEGIKEIREVMAGLEALGITNTVFDQTLMRGFDYYTGIVFEVYDLNPKNRRSVFGGGRYDDLLSIFGGEKVPAVGFGAGDVIAQDILETYGKIPEYTNSTELFIGVTDRKFIPYALETAQTLREKGLRVAVDYSARKIGDQIKTADKNKISHVLILGENEKNTGELKIKNLGSGEERACNVDTIIKFIEKNRK
jgi:histidyl-tRNA synthetase